MYSADVPAILSARKTYSFSVESNPAHARPLPSPFPPSLSHDAHTFRFAKHRRRRRCRRGGGGRPSFCIFPSPARARSSQLSLPRGSSFVSFLACPASCSLILMLVSFLPHAAFFNFPLGLPISRLLSFSFSFFTIFHYGSLAYLRICFFAFLQFQALSLRLRLFFLHFFFF